MRVSLANVDHNVRQYQCALSRECMSKYVRAKEKYVVREYMIVYICELVVLLVCVRVCVSDCV